MEDVKCGKKVRYKREREAKLAARRLSEEFGSRLEAYWCKKHRCWHVGDMSKMEFWASKNIERKAKG